MKIKVMKGPAIGVENVDTIKLPMMASPKLDGIRAVMVGGKLLTQNGLPVRNLRVRQWCEKNLFDGADGELLLRDKTAPFREVSSAIMNGAGEPDFVFACFDVMRPDMMHVPFVGRLDYCVKRMTLTTHFEMVDQRYVESHEELMTAIGDHSRDGYEGTIIKRPDCPYWPGRSTPRKGYMFKLKSFSDDEAVVTGVYEEMENVGSDLTAAGNKAGGADNKLGKGSLGGVLCRFADGTEFRCGSGFDAEERKYWWKERAKLVGRAITVKHQPPPGGRQPGEKPRFPVFKALREDL